MTVPSHRLDVSSAADVAEEVARAHGYERIDGRLPHAALPPYRPDPSEPRHSCAASWPGSGSTRWSATRSSVRWISSASGATRRDAELIRVFNPLSEEHSILRPSMTPSLLGGLAENARRRQPDAWLFELGKVYWHPGPADAARPRVGDRRHRPLRVMGARHHPCRSARPRTRRGAARPRTWPRSRASSTRCTTRSAPRDPRTRRAGGRAASAPSSGADGASSSMPPAVRTARSARCTRASSRPGA